MKMDGDEFRDCLMSFGAADVGHSCVFLFSFIIIGIFHACVRVHARWWQRLVMVSIGSPIVMQLCIIILETGGAMDKFWMIGFVVLFPVSLSSALFMEFIMWLYNRLRRKMRNK